MSCLEDRISFLEPWFLEKLHKNRKDQYDINCIRMAMHDHYGSGMEMKNHELAEKLCVSEKTFYRYFKNSIGTNPKTYFSIVRARTALTAYRKDREGFSPYNFGYYDFGHFSKDVVKFTGSLLSGF
jgi:AraC-like DNA-binding protein